MALSTYGSYLTVTSNQQVNVYETVNGHLVETGKMKDENIPNDKLIVCAAFQDDTTNSVDPVT